MPGFKGIEKLEGREGKAPLGEFVELDNKVEPFLHSAIAKSEVPGSFYQAPQTDAMKGFLQIGERGSYPSTRESFNTSRAMPDIPRESLGFHFWIDSIREFFRPALERFDLDGPGFAAPLMILSFLLKGDHLKQMPYEEFQSTRESLEKNLGYPQTARFLNLVTFERGTASFHDSWVSRGWVEVGELGAETRQRVAVTTTAYQHKFADPSDPSGPKVRGAASAPDAVEGYRLHAGTEASAGTILIQTQDRALVESIHQAFVKVYSALGSPLTALDWLLYKSQWAKSGLFEWDH